MIFYSKWLLSAPFIFLLFQGNALRAAPEAPFAQELQVPKVKSTEAKHVFEVLKEIPLDGYLDPIRSLHMILGSEFEPGAVAMVALLGRPGFSPAFIYKGQNSEPVQIAIKVEGFEPSHYQRGLVEVGLHHFVISGTRPIDKKPSGAILHLWWDTKVILSKPHLRVLDAEPNPESGKTIPNVTSIQPYASKTREAGNYLLSGFDDKSIYILQVKSDFSFLRKLKISVLGREGSRVTNAFAIPRMDGFILVVSNFYQDAMGEARFILLDRNWKFIVQEETKELYHHVFDGILLPNGEIAFSSVQSETLSLVKQDAFSPSFESNLTYTIGLFRNNNSQSVIHSWNHSDFVTEGLPRYGRNRGLSQNRDAGSFSTSWSDGEQMMYLFSDQGGKLLQKVKIPNWLTLTSLAPIPDNEGYVATAWDENRKHSTTLLHVGPGNIITRQK